MIINDHFFLNSKYSFFFENPKGLAVLIFYFSDGGGNFFTKT